MWATLFIALALGSTFCRGAIYENVAELEKLNMQFDFIVVGGKRDRWKRRCKLPFGERQTFGFSAGSRWLVIATPNTPWDWNYTTTPQVGLNGRTVAFPRGFVLGGSSSVNYMVYTRGSKEDFDRFALIADDERWSWDNLIPYMKKNEQFTQPADHHNTTGQFNPAVHGFNGINSVTLSGFPSPIDDRVIETTQELAEFPFNLDMNSGDPIGVGWGQMTVKDGSRSSSATSYLAPQFVSRPNLHVLLHARVTRVLPTASNDFRTVEFVQDLKGKRMTLSAKKEIVLSAGSVGTPTILMYSGIGNSSALQSLGIKPLHNLPSVGQNLTDHSLLPLGWLVDSTDTFDTEARNTTALWSTTRQRISDGSGFPTTLPYSSASRDPSAGPNTAHYEHLYSNGFLGTTPPTGNYLGITSAVVSPASRGSITLNTSDPLAPPLINPNLLASEFDIFIMRYAVRSALRFAASKPWADYVIAPPVGVNNTSTDDELDDYIRQNAGSVFHPVGTASVSPVGAKFGVVDPDLSVKGLTGLRVVDLSVMNRIPAAHSQAAAYIIGERGADMIKETWS
ncbi:Alcohol oxidase [Mycena venus]|uniref:Alcohol oxidase n=1 Tax=Mycena venus TaxID=2733690 RepID=A0A8H6YB39_9AGAR|nr:Alcohol oxidase [Mycena venus]